VSASLYDDPLSAIREHAENLGAWLGIWEGRTEPDAHARRCASDAVDRLNRPRLSRSFPPSCPSLPRTAENLHGRPLDHDQGGEREPGAKASLDTTLASSPELAS
jgi:hypothetical protein